MPPRFYRIRIFPELRASWAESFPGLEVATLQPGSTELSGVVADQAALHGVLARLRDLGVTIDSIQSQDPQQERATR